MGIEATIVGTPDSDVLTGTSEDDVIAGLGGDDVIAGGGGTDIICGGGGRDEIKGHGDLLGGTGNDLIRGTYLVDRFYGGPGDDVIRGGPMIDGQGYQPDEIRFTYARSGVSVDLGAQSAMGEGTDELHGIESVYGSPHADVLIGGIEPANFVTGGGDDSVFGGPGGYDFIDFRSAPQGVVVDLNGSPGSGWGTFTVSGIENVNGSYFDDVLIGNDDRNQIMGDRGTDQLRGGAGRDFLFEACNCGLGPVEPEDFRTNGSALGGPGRDWVFGTHGDNILKGGPGNDLIFGLLGNDVIVGGKDGMDVAHFGGSYDRYYTSEPIVFGTWLLDYAVTVDLTTGTAEGQGLDELFGIEGVLGSDRDDEIVGGPGINKLWGLGGNDTLSGEGGEDLLNGGPFVDECVGSPEATKVECEH